MGKVKLGVVGCGASIAYMYGPIFKYLENGEFVAAMDPNRKRLEQVKEMYHPKELYTDFEKMLKESSLDAIIISSPVFLHKEQVTKAAKAGKHILCEKPMARTIDECDKMIEVCRKNSIILMTAFMKRFDKSFRYAKDLIDEGNLGKVFQVRWDWSWHSYTAGGWRDSLKTWGSIFQDHGSHTVDLCRWWLGEIETVSGEISILLKGREVEDQAVATLRHKNGAVSIHCMTRMTHKPLNEYVLIDGTKASLEIQFGPDWSALSTNPFSMKVYKNGKGVTDITRINDKNIDIEIKNHGRYKKELEHFCDCILGKKKPLTTGEDGRKSIEVINAIYLSSWKKEKVRLPLKKSPDLEKLFNDLKGG